MTRRANHFRFTEIVSSEKSTRIENNSLYQNFEMWHKIAIPSRPEGRSRSPRTRDGLRWTWKRLSERRGSVRQRRVVLTPRSWRLRWQQCKAHRGERVISRKAIAQGMPDVLRCPVCSCAHFFYPLRMRPRVQRASGIPCALWIWGQGFPANLGRNASRECETVSTSLRAQRSNPFFLYAA